MSEWNPIQCGVPDDEYDAYIPGIYTLMQRNVSIQELAKHLRLLETGPMGLEPMAANIRLHVATLLLDVMKDSSEPEEESFD